MGEKAIKQVHRTQLDGIGERKTAAIDLLRDELKADRALRDQEWTDLKERFAGERAELKCELEMSEHEPSQDGAPDIERNQYGDEIIDMSGPVEPEQPPPLEPDSYVPVRHQPEPDLDREMGD